MQDRTFNTLEEALKFSYGSDTIIERHWHTTPPKVVTGRNQHPPVRPTYTDYRLRLRAFYDPLIDSYVWKFTRDN